MVLIQIAALVPAGAEPVTRASTVAQPPTPERNPAGATESAARPKPNIAVIVLDDAGFAATSMFGGVARTPAFEALAREGLRYNRFHVSAICAPTRAALLSGRNPHQVGFGTVPEIATAEPGYNSIWPKSAASLPELLRRSGYATAAFGKWHNTPAWEWSPVGPFDHWPTGLGFDYFYGTMGTTSSWEPLLWRGTTAVSAPKSAEQGYNLTTDLVDDAVSWLHTRETLAPERPYFLYFATTATHSPHQVPREWIDRYRGAFSAGWDALRAQILTRQKRLGIVPANVRLTSRPPGLPAWKTLTSAERAVAERQMEVLAGYMSQTDHEVGRLIEAIRGGPNGADTLILFMGGDNGSSGDDGIAGCDDCPIKPPAAGDRLSYLDDLGGPERISESDAGWAFMNDTPFEGMKRQASHLGATRVPLILSWPGHVAAGRSVRSQWINVTDIAPTLLDVLGLKPPTTVDGIPQLPLAGTSFAASLTDAAAPSTHHVQYFETFGSRAIYRDGWMASMRYLTPWNLAPVFDHKGPEKGADTWHLYHLETDFAQAHDVARAHPAMLASLRTLFDVEAKANQVYPLGVTYDKDGVLPSLTRKRESFVFFPDLPILAWDALPNFRRGYRIDVSLHLADGRSGGLLMSNGSRGRGFALYMKDGHVIYESDRVDAPARLTSSAALLSGAHVVTVDVSKAPSEYGGGGGGVRHVSIAFDGVRSIEGDLPDEEAPFYGGATLSIGAQRVAIVSPGNPAPFTGRIDTVRLRYTSPE